MNRPTAIDLFSGGGGLTLGLRQAGFAVVAAVEIEKNASATYQANHPNTVLYQRDIRLINGTELIKASPTGKIDLVAGCPPCQGFSTLTSKHRRDDPRNELVLEFTRLVLEIRPPLVMMENVPGLQRMPQFTQLCSQLKEAGYSIKDQIVNAVDFGVPQQRKRLGMLASRIGEINFPQRTHGPKGTKQERAWSTVGEALEGFLIEKPIEMSLLGAGVDPRQHNWHVVRSLSETNRARLKAARPGKGRNSLPEHLRPDCHKGMEHGFSNVYGRMEWDKPSPTITGGCTTLSKGRFGHPKRLRTISVREAAVLQGFPKSYKIDTPYIDQACQIIGNALPPQIAKALGTACINHLNEYEQI